MKKGEINTFAVIVIIIAIVLVTAIVIAIISGNQKQPEGENLLQNSTTNTEQTPQTTRPTIEGNEYVSESNGLKTNTSSKLKEDKTYGQYKFTNIRLQTDANGSVLLADVTTTATEKQEGKEVTIKFIDKEGNELVKIGAYIGQIKPGETKTFRTETTTDITNVYDFIIE